MKKGKTSHKIASRSLSHYNIYIFEYLNSFDETLNVPGTNLEPDLEEMKMDDVDIDKVGNFSLNAVRI